MINNNSQPAGIETISLKALVRTVLRRWKLIVILMAAGGLITGAFHFLIEPVYTATSVISIDPDVLVGNSLPTFLLVADEIKASVAAEFKMEITDLPLVTVTTDKTDKSITKISLDLNDPVLAVDMINFWAATAVDWIIENSNQSETDFNSAVKQVTTATSELNSYLQSNNLGDLSWYELVLVTGVTTPENVSLGSITRELPKISAKQRNEISALLRKKEAAEWNYTMISQDVLTSKYQSNLRVRVVNKAIEAENSSILGSVLIIPLGVILGLLISLIWILIEDWWKNSELPAETQSS